MPSKDKKYIIWLLVVDVLVILIAFFWVGPYSIRTDTDHYVNQINVMRGDVKVGDLEGPFREMYYYKIYKPFYGLVSVFPFFAITPVNVILFVNILFLIGLSISVYYFLSMEYDERISFVGASWVVTGYPVFKYGLAMVTDISGWFFAISSILLFLRGIRVNSPKYVVLASLVGFLGSISKETGVLGLLFCGLYLLFHFKEYGVHKLSKLLFFLCFPFAILQAVLTVFMSRVGASSLFDWIKFNYGIFFNDFYKFKYFLSNEFLAFGLIWFFALFGFVLYLRENFWKDRERLIVFLSSVFATSVVLLWPVFYYRIIFIQFVFIIPLAMYGLKSLLNRPILKNRPYILYCLLCLPPVFNILLFVLIKKY